MVRVGPHPTAGVTDKADKTLISIDFFPAIFRHCPQKAVDSHPNSSAHLVPMETRH